MIESIFIGLSGLSSSSSGLKTIANNVANLNTPGFKGSTLQFANLFYTQGGLAGGNAGNASSYGLGVRTLGSTVNFSQGELRQTGGAFDLAIQGAGMFVLRDTAGELRYSRAGQFEFSPDGVLVDRSTGLQVMALGADGQLSRVDVSPHRVSPPKATGTIKFTGNLSSTETEKTVSGVTVIDAAGLEHSLSLKFTSQSAVQSGQWTVTLMDGATSLGAVTLNFDGGVARANASQLSFKYTPPGQPQMTVVMDFGGEVTSFASGTLSTLAMLSQDGYLAGSLTGYSFDEKGVLQYSFNNGQKAQGARLALASAQAPQLLRPIGDNLFELLGGRKAQLGSAGDGEFGSLSSGHLELSNVDLSREFSDMIVMQRGYQASSQVVSTANDMLQELFSMKR